MLSTRENGGDGYKLWSLSHFCGKFKKHIQAQLTGPGEVESLKSEHFLFSYLQIADLKVSLSRTDMASLTYIISNEPLI